MDKLTRTVVWLEQMRGGIDRLKEVVGHDWLGICDQLEPRMQFLFDSFRWEWKEVVDDPQRRELFRPFVNTGHTETGIEIGHERGPAHRPKDIVAVDEINLPNGQPRE